MHVPIMEAAAAKKDAERGVAVALQASTCLLLQWGLWCRASQACWAWSCQGPRAVPYM